MSIPNHLYEPRDTPPGDDTCRACGRPRLSAVHRALDRVGELTSARPDAEDLELSLGTLTEAALEHVERLVAERDRLRAELQQQQALWQTALGHAAEQDGEIKALRAEVEHASVQHVAALAELERVRGEAERLRQGVEEANRFADHVREHRDALAEALLECWRVEKAGTVTLEDMGVPTPPSPWLAAADAALRLSGKLP